MKSVTHDRLLSGATGGGAELVVGVVVAVCDLVLLHHVQPEVGVQPEDGFGEDLLRRKVREEAVGVVNVLSLLGLFQRRHVALGEEGVSGVQGAQDGQQPADLGGVVAGEAQVQVVLVQDVVDLADDQVFAGWAVAGAQPQLLVFGAPYCATADALHPGDGDYAGLV